MVINQFQTHFLIFYMYYKIVHIEYTTGRLYLPSIMHISTIKMFFLQNSYIIKGEVGINDQNISTYL